VIDYNGNFIIIPFVSGLSSVYASTAFFHGTEELLGGYVLPDVPSSSREVRFSIGVSLTHQKSK